MEEVTIIIEEAPVEEITIVVNEINGDKGEKGDKGNQGDIGVKGDKGDKGDTGPAGISPSAETQQSLIAKIGYATDMAAGVLSPEDHLLFKSKQPAGQYVPAEAGKSLMTATEHQQLAMLWQVHLNS